LSDPLSGRLRAATGVLHRQAEGTPFMAALVAGRLNAKAYCLMLRNLEPIYGALEDGLQRHATHAAVAPVVLPALFRTATLRDDLHALHGDTWSGDLPLVPECQLYIARLRTIAADAPALLVAHAYVRYLGDLSGGQMLKHIVARSLGLAPQARGTAFYDFGGPDGQVAALAGRLRAGLDLSGQALPDDDAVVQEAVDAFGMHCVLFAELADACALPA
jgi:heme oxygenase (biliverdin-producing, ferredoxin)